MKVARQPCNNSLSMQYNYVIKATHINITISLDFLTGVLHATIR